MSLIIDRIRRIGAGVMNEIRGECECSCHTDYTHERIKIPGSVLNEAIERDLERSMVCARCACPPSLPQIKTSRRGFISMLGAGLVVAAAPKILSDGVELLPPHPHLTDRTAWWIADRRKAELIADASRKFQEHALAAIASPFSKITYDAERAMFVVESIQAHRVYVWSADGSSWQT